MMAAGKQGDRVRQAITGFREEAIDESVTGT